jgi:hypothetical protein
MLYYNVESIPNVFDKYVSLDVLNHVTVLCHFLWQKIFSIVYSHTENVACALKQALH